jgi:N4-(beta-N-acetylglucosaminyl)-L-asparaginase
MDKMTRRSFISTVAGTSAALTGGALAAGATALQGSAAGKGTRPLVISSSNGLNALDLGMGLLKRGHDTLDAVIATVNIVENDPNDDSVGYGGLPNEECEVELDASVMHGPSRRAGSVASIRGIKNPSKVARLVMERTDHIMLAGHGALRFAKAHGLPEENLLTERSRIAWLAWKESMSDRDSWGAGIMSPDWREKTARLLPPQLSAEEKEIWLARIHEVVSHPPTGTINCLAVNEKGEISGTTTTSGLAWKIPGRVGDSPIIGGGLYVDNDIGAAGSTGRGEENIRVCGAHTIVEMMRQGKSPKDACLEALSRVAHIYGNDKTRLRRFHLLFYALNKDGVHGGASLWAARRGGRRAAYAVHDGTQARLAECAGLFEGENT